VGDQSAERTTQSVGGGQVLPEGFDLLGRPGAKQFSDRRNKGRAAVQPRLIAAVRVAQRFVSAVEDPGDRLPQQISTGIVVASRPPQGIYEA